MTTFKITKEKIQKLNDFKREGIMPREKILAPLGDLKGKVLADVGCGTGYYTKDFSKMVGTSGKVLAIDVSPEMMEQVTYKTKGMSNVTNHLSAEKKIPVKDNSVDVAVSILSFHEFDDKEDTLKEIKRILKDNGRFYVVDFNPEASPPPGPPIEERILKEDLILVCEDMGFKFNGNHEIGPQNYGLMFCVK